MSRPLDYEPQRPTRSREQVRRGRAALGWLTAVVFIVNMVPILFGAIEQDGFRAMGIAYLACPLANGLALLAALMFTDRVRRVAGAAAVPLYVIASILLPACAVYVDHVIIRYCVRPGGHKLPAPGPPHPLPPLPSSHGTSIRGGPPHPGARCGKSLPAP